MFEVFVLVLFVWIFIHAVKLTFRVSWGLAKIVAVILFAIALPALIACLLMAGGIVLLVPVVLVATAFGILKVCV